MSMEQKSRDFLDVQEFRLRKEYGFLYNPPVEGTVSSMEQMTWVFVKLMSKNSISGWGKVVDPRKNVGEYPPPTPHGFPSPFPLPAPQTLSSHFALTLSFSGHYPQTESNSVTLPPHHPPPHSPISKRGHTQSYLLIIWVVFRWRIAFA